MQIPNTLILSRVLSHSSNLWASEDDDVDLICSGVTPKTRSESPRKMPKHDVCLHATSQRAVVFNCHM